MENQDVILSWRDCGQFCAEEFSSEAEAFKAALESGSDYRRSDSPYFFITNFTTLAVKKYRLTVSAVEAL